jgi:hypothetical protein
MLVSVPRPYVFVALVCVLRPYPKVGSSVHVVPGVCGVGVSILCLLRVLPWLSPVLSPSLALLDLERRSRGGGRDNQGRIRSLYTRSYIHREGEGVRHLPVCYRDFDYSDFIASPPRVAA